MTIAPIRTESDTYRRAARLLAYAVDRYRESGYRRGEDRDGQENQHDEAAFFLLVLHFTL